MNRVLTNVWQRQIAIFNTLLSAVPPIAQEGKCCAPFRARNCAKASGQLQFQSVESIASDELCQPASPSPASSRSSVGQLRLYTFWDVTFAPDEGVDDEHDGAGDEEAVGDVEVGPGLEESREVDFAPFETDPVANAVLKFWSQSAIVPQAEAVVEVAKDTAADQAEGDGDPAIVRGAIDKQPGDDSAERDGG